MHGYRNKEDTFTIPTLTPNESAPEIDDIDAPQ